MGLPKSLNKRLTALEAKYTLNDVPGNRWPSFDCDPNRRLARYAAYFKGQQWECIGTPQQKAKNEAKLARYNAYFDNLGDHNRRQCLIR